MMIFKKNYSAIYVKKIVTLYPMALLEDSKPLQKGNVCQFHQSTIRENSGKKKHRAASNEVCVCLCACVDIFISCYLCVINHGDIDRNNFESMKRRIKIII